MNSSERRNVQRDFACLSNIQSRLHDAIARREARQLVAWIRPPKHALVLDAACGSGTGARALAPLTAHVTGVDIVPSMIDIARKIRAPASVSERLSWTVGDAERLPFRSRQFDLINCAYAFANFLHPLRVLLEFARVTRRGGRIAVADVFAPEDKKRRHCLNRIEALRGHAHTRIMTRAEFLELFKRAHLGLVSSRTHCGSQNFRAWLRLSPAGADPRRARLLRRMILSSVEGDKAGLSPRRGRRDIILHHSVAWFLLRCA